MWQCFLSLKRDRPTYLTCCLAITYLARELLSNMECCAHPWLHRVVELLLQLDHKKTLANALKICVCEGNCVANVHALQQYQICSFTSPHPDTQILLNENSWTVLLRSWVAFFPVSIISNCTLSR